MRLSRMSIIVSVLTIGLAAPAVSVAQDFGRQQYRYEGRTYERLRELAHVLDQRAQHAANQAVLSAPRRGRSQQRFLNDITHFAQQAADFHRRMDRYRESPWDVPNEIDHLTDDARRVNREIRNGRVFEHTWDDWNAALDVLGQMQRTAAVAEGRDRGYDRDRDRSYRRY
jgi:hypothetical protein